MLLNLTVGTILFTDKNFPLEKNKAKSTLDINTKTSPTNNERPFRYNFTTKFKKSRRLNFKMKSYFYTSKIFLERFFTPVKNFFAHNGTLVLNKMTFILLMIKIDS